MTLCLVCKKEIKTNDNMAILSYPIKCQNQYGGYSVYDFIRNERIIHFNCLKIGESLIESEKNQDVYNSLLAMGLTPVKSEVFDFVLMNDEKPVEDILELWFKRRN